MAFAFFERMAGHKLGSNRCLKTALSYFFFKFIQGNHYPSVICAYFLCFLRVYFSRKNIFLPENLKEQFGVSLNSQKSLHSKSLGVWMVNDAFSAPKHFYYSQAKFQTTAITVLLASLGAWLSDVFSRSAFLSNLWANSYHY